MHNNAAQLLISLRAELNGGVEHPIHLAATSNNVEGLRLLCAAGGDVKVSNVFGMSGAANAAATGGELWPYGGAGATVTVSGAQPP